MYLYKISVEWQDAHAGNVDNKILDMIEKLKLSENTNSPRR